MHTKTRTQTVLSHRERKVGKEEEYEEKGEKGGKGEKEIKRTKK